MIRRILGFIILLIGLAGIVLGLLGNRVGHQVIDAVTTAVSDVLLLTSDSLDTVQETLLITKDTVTLASDSLTTVETAAVNLGGAILQTQPLIEEISKVTSVDLPNSLEAVQETIPTVAQAAGVIDDTLVSLNRLRFEETIPFINYTISWSLGVDYAPTIPFDTAVIQIGESLEPLPGRLRNLEQQLLVTSGNLQMLSDDVYLIADDLTLVNTQIQALNPLLDEYIATVTRINDTARMTRASINEQLERLKMGITYIMIWLVLFQVVPLYLGYTLLMGQQPGRETAVPLLAAAEKDAS